jgi:hypothetical protein
MFDTKEFGWANVSAVMLGKEIKGLRGVSYKVSHEKEHIYARGNEPVTIGRGNKKYEGELTLLQSELEALISAAGTGHDVTDLPPFDVVVAYVPNASTTIITDIIKGCEFTESEKAFKQGDKFMEVKLPFVAMRAELNV